MKKFIFLLAGLFLTGFTVNAGTISTNANAPSTFYGGYGNSFIFVEDGIEFSVFRDGQFDFNILRGNSRLGVSLNSPNVSISFNSGYDYDAYVQYDEFGAVIQIENTPVFYDYYGRVNQIGNIQIHYNNFGYINRVGGLYVHYNRSNTFSHFTGFINIYNRAYVYRPWHRFYSIPAYDYCVVYNRPYRQFYAPVRYVYNRPFYNNYRPRTAIATRRGNTIIRNRNYATVNRSDRNVTRVNTNAISRRVVAQNNRGERPDNNVDINRTVNRNTTVKRDNNSEININRNTTIRRANNSNNNRTIERNTRPSVNTIGTRTTNNRVSQKPNNSNTRIYNSSNTKTRNTQVTPRPVNKPRETSPQRSVTRLTQSSKPTATQSRSNSYNNTRSIERRRS